VYLWKCNGQDQQSLGYNEVTGEIFFEASAIEAGSSASSDAPMYTTCLDSFNQPAVGNRVQISACNKTLQ
jgi:hypothetical protein